MIEVNDKNYNEVVLKDERPIFIDFYSPSCDPCQDLGKFLEERIKNYAEEKNVLIIKCNVMKSPKLSEKLNIRSVPFTIYVTKEKEFKYPEIGVREPEYYFKIIDKISEKKKKFLGIF